MEVKKLGRNEQEGEFNWATFIGGFVVGGIVVAIVIAVAVASAN